MTPLPVKEDKSGQTPLPVKEDKSGQTLQGLRDSIGHPSKNLYQLEFTHSFCIQFRVSWYITGLNRTSEEKFIVIRIFLVLLFSISSVLIYEGTQSDIRVKSYGRLNLLRVTVLNFVCLDILQDSIGLSSKKLLSFEFFESFYNSTSSVLNY